MVGTVLIGDLGVQLQDIENLVLVDFGVYQDLQTLNYPSQYFERNIIQFRQIVVGIDDQDDKVQTGTVLTPLLTYHKFIQKLKMERITYDSITN